jgi:carboxylesterase
MQRSSITDDLLDGNVIFDPSLYNPEQFLVSEKYLIPQHQIWINISSLLFMAIRLPLLSGRNLDWSAPSSYRISQVLLDGHGRDYESFKASMARLELRH